MRFEVNFIWMTYTISLFLRLSLSIATPPPPAPCYFFPSSAIVVQWFAVSGRALRCVLPSFGYTGELSGGRWRARLGYVWSGFSSCGGRKKRRSWRRRRRPPSAWNSVRSIDHCDCRFHTANGTRWIFMVVHHSAPRFVKISRKTVSILFFTLRSQIILSPFPSSL